ncbi:helix-turn-helix domain-containing protein, partial [Klebsiella pneumoniae]|uniref:helix-turn-helix domain-containing protein n=1 Tax=Klebsiella pneumoniae TaxID=573 RepID=UPI00216AC024
MPIIAPIPRDERRLMQKAIHKTRDKNYARRLTAMLMLHRGERVSHVARTLCCARSSIGRWINWFTLSGAEGLKSLPSGRGRRWPFEHICALLRELVKLYGSTTYCNFYSHVKYSPLASSVRVIYVAFCCYTAPDIQPFF